MSGIARTKTNDVNKHVSASRWVDTG